MAVSSPMRTPAKFPAEENRLCLRQSGKTVDRWEEGNIFSCHHEFAIQLATSMARFPPVPTSLLRSSFSDNIVTVESIYCAEDGLALFRMMA